MKEQLKLKGHIKSFIIRENGDVEQLMDKSNTIHANIRGKINDSFLSSQNYALDNLFSTNEAGDQSGTSGKDGIVLFDSSSRSETMICSTSEPSSTSVKITGTFTGTAWTVTNAKLGFNWTISAEDFTVIYATPSSWTSAVLGASDTLTVEWTLSI